MGKKKRRGATRVVLEDYKAKMAEEGAVDVVLNDGSIFRIPPPALWPDAFTERSVTDPEFAKNPEAQARMLVGDLEYDRFVFGGGNAMLFHSLIGYEHDEDTGESQPSSDS